MDSQTPLGLGQPGTYLLWMHAASSLTIKIGKLGEWRLPAGHYAYVGSAFGPGGIAARVGRHLRDQKRNHWHIDYLRAALAIDAVWFTHDLLHREHAWAGQLKREGGAGPVKGFGASDCNCATHLLWFPKRPAFDCFSLAPLNRDLAIQQYPHH